MFFVQELDLQFKFKQEVEDYFYTFSHLYGEVPEKTKLVVYEHYPVLIDVYHYLLTRANAKVMVPNPAAAPSDDQTPPPTIVSKKQPEFQIDTDWVAEMNS